MKQLTENLSVKLTPVTENPKLHEVVRMNDGEVVFTGTMAEIRRWLPIHLAKCERAAMIPDKARRAPIKKKYTSHLVSWHRDENEPFKRRRAFFKVLND